jgi:hypothetical protein
MPATSARRADPSPSRGPAAAVRRAVGSVSPIVTMWRDGLTIIALESREPNRSPEYLTFEQAQAAQGIEVEEAPVQTVPTVNAATGPMPVLLLGGDTIIGGAQNRIINITILLKAAAKTAIPVRAWRSTVLSCTISARCTPGLPGSSIIRGPKLGREGRPMAARDTVERKIQFFRLSTPSDDPASRQPVRLGDVLLDLQSLPAGDRYFEADGRTTGLWVESVSPPRIRLVDIRRSGFPDVERAGSLHPLRIAADAGLAEQVHVVGFQRGVVGADFNWYGPRVSRLAVYLSNHTRQKIEAASLVDPDVARELDEIGELRMFKLRIDRSLLDEVRRADRSLYETFQNAFAAGEGGTVEVVLRVTPYQRDASLNQGLFGVIRDLIRRPDVATRAKSFKVEGRSSHEGPLRSIDLLSQQLATTRQLPRARGRSRGVDSEAAFGEIESAYAEMRPSIDGALGIIEAGNA